MKGTPMIIEPEYQQTLDYLFTFVDFSLTKRDTLSKESFSLDRMRRFLDLLGNPHKQYPCVHVTGTKGKGSTSAFITSILRCSGSKVGLFTSPHLVDYNERIQIDGQSIPPVRVWISPSSKSAWAGGWMPPM